MPTPTTPSHRPHGPTAAWLPTALLATALAAGCGRAAGPTESQVAVHVNDSEISLHQVQAMLTRQPRALAAGGDAAANQVLATLVSQELAAQAARREGLDADHMVIQSIEASRRELLARAYQDRVTAKATIPTSDAIDRYYDAHPGLFADRRLYFLQETVVQAPDTDIAALRARVPQFQSGDDLAKHLRESGLRHAGRQMAQAAEDLPLAVVEPLMRAKVGQSVVVAQPGGARVLTVLDMRKAPVDRRLAAPVIARYLLAESKRELTAEAMQRLRKDAKIRYLGAFAPASAASAAPLELGGAASAPR